MACNTATNLAPEPWIFPGVIIFPTSIADGTTNSPDGLYQNELKNFHSFAPSPERQWH